MIAYRNYYESVLIDRSINRIEELLQKIQGSSDRYSDAVSLLIETGELETGLTDIYCKNVDRISPEITMCRNISICSGVIVCKLWLNNELSMDRIYRIHTFLSALRLMKLPLYMEIGVPEGFVFYGLYPETYLEAALDFYHEKRPESVVVLGLRSIGTQLSAVVASGLELSGCKVATCTVRPRGEPFNRKLDLDETLSKLLVQFCDAYFLVVDEGPGLSGSSIGGTVQKLNELGIDKSKIVIFPSWNPDGSQLNSEAAAEVWRQYRKFTGDFDQIWVNSGRLEEMFGKRIVRNLSAGLWRKMLYQNETDFPGVHPHHERRKFLLESPTNKKSIIKFVGLGKYGYRYLRRAQSLAEANFSPEVEKLQGGFIELAFRKGVPLSAGDIDERLLDFVIKYLEFINCNFKADLRVDFAKMMEMLYCNIEQGIGSEFLLKVDKIAKLYKNMYEEDVVDVDGRLMPHDFLKNDQGYIKVDHLEHHADQFFHGPQNIAWDIAGLCIEFGLTENRREQVISKFRSVDPFIEKKIPFFLVAYSACRLGYVKLAADSLFGNSDANKLRCRERLLVNILKSQLSRI